MIQQEILYLFANKLPRKKYLRLANTLPYLSSIWVLRVMGLFHTVPLKIIQLFLCPPDFLIKFIIAWYELSITIKNELKKETRNNGPLKGSTLLHGYYSSKQKWVEKHVGDLLHQVR